MTSWLKTLFLPALIGVAGLPPAFASSAEALPEQPVMQVEKKTLHFSFPEKGSIWQKYQADAVDLSSNEYWFEVSGSDLKTGVSVDLSDPGALIRFSPVGSVRAALDISKLAFFRNNQKLPFAIESMASGSEMPEETLLGDSNIIQLSEVAGSGRLTLKSAQTLYAKDRYLVYVKEVNSSKKLRMSAPRLHMLAGETFAFKAAVTDELFGEDEAELEGVTYHSYLMSPTGKIIYTTMKMGVEDSWIVELPSKLTSVAPGELYELYIEASRAEQNGMLRRKGKLAAAIARPTASLENLRPVFTITRGVAATITLNVVHEGRYEARGTIYGTDDAGKLRSVMRSHSAYWLKPGLQDIDLMFDTDALLNSGLKAPYKLMSFQLLDQSQLAVLYSQDVTG